LTTVVILSTDVSNNNWQTSLAVTLTNAVTPHPLFGTSQNSYFGGQSSAEENAKVVKAA
jgi:hypothetical protein